MAARINLKHDSATRAKIQTSQLVNRLNKIALGEVVVDQTQLRAIEILLRKALPDLSTITLQGDENGGPLRHEFSWQDDRADRADIASTVAEFAVGASDATH
jgi:hypothetical protein